MIQLKPSDFPELDVDIVPPPPTGRSAVNVLILLHGLGDSNEPFTQFGRNINLAETTCISVRGTNPIPALILGHENPSFHWAADVVVDNQTGLLDIDGDFSKSLSLLSTSLLEPLLTTHKVPARQIFFYGYGQGGILALSLLSSPSFASQEFGGLISIGGRLSSSMSTPSKAEGKARTPVLACAGSKSKEVTKDAVEKVRAVYRDVEYVKWAKPGDGMPASREEIQPIFAFLGRRLRSRAGVPDDALEI